MKPLSRPTYLKIVRASAWYDLIASALFATPWTFALLHQAVSGLNQMLGGAPLPAFGPLQTMIASMMGTVVVIWSAVRLLEPGVRLGRLDGTGRFLFSSWMAWALLATGAPILWVMVIPEFAWGVIQWLPLEQGVTIREIQHAKDVHTAHEQHPITNQANRGNKWQLESR